jgi:hypothetical protein
MYRRHFPPFLHGNGRADLVQHFFKSVLRFREQSVVQFIDLRLVVGNELAAPIIISVLSSSLRLWFTPAYYLGSVCSSFWLGAHLAACSLLLQSFDSVLAFGQLVS